MPKLVAEVLRDLMAERRWSQAALSRATVRVSYPGVSENTIKAILKNAGRVPDAAILEALAAAVDRRPDDLFYEYPIAVARRDKVIANDRLPHIAEALEREAQQSRERPADTDEEAGSSGATGGQQ